MDLSTMTLAELNEMSKDQLITALTEGRTETTVITSEGDERGQAKEVRETRDIAGALLSTQEVEWSYWKNGAVDTIVTIEKDGKGKETSRRVVSH